MIDDLLFEEIYQKTQDCGRTQFVRLLQNNQIKIEELQKENKILNNIVTEFEKWLIDNYYLDIPDVATNSQTQEIYDKLQEIKAKYDI